MSEQTSNHATEGGNSLEGSVISPAFSGEDRRLHSTCRLCHQENYNRSYWVREMLFGTREQFEYFECSNCRCLQIRETPSDLGRFYRDGYAPLEVWPPDYFKGGIRSFLKRQKTLYAIRGSGLLGRILYARSPEIGLGALSLIKPSLETRILDVGCGNGIRLYELRNAGFTHLLGVDPFVAKDIHYDNGLTIRKAMLSEITGPWDVVMFHHSFEHLSDPVETLSHVYSLLPSRGYCLIRVPTTSGWAWEHYRENWAQIDAPRHQFLHSQQSLTLLAGATGFRAERFIYDSTEFQFYASEWYMNDIPLDEACKSDQQQAQLASKLKTMKARAAKLNQAQEGDQFACLLRKP